MWPGVQGAGLAAQGQQAGDEEETDAEAAGQLAERIFPGIDGVGHVLMKSIE